MKVKIFASVLLVAMMLSVFGTSIVVLAEGGGVTIPNPLGSTDFGGLLRKIADAVGTLIATLGTIMIIVAGILYLTSAGSPERMSKAKTALVYAIAGIVIGLAAKGIVEIIEQTLGVTP